MADSSSSALVAPAASSTLAAAASAPIRWQTADMQHYGMTFHAFIQKEHIDVEHLGGLHPAAAGLATSFRIMEEDQQMGHVNAARVFPLTKVISHGTKMYERFIVVCSTYLVILLLGFDVFGCYVLFVSAVCVCVVCVRCC